MIWTAEAPSNIALIKYMGKRDHYHNLPTNPSLSYTLPHFRSIVRIEKSDQAQHSWQPLQDKHWIAPKLSPRASNRFLEHIERIKQALNSPNHYFNVQSANNFPSACGLASSAASFAALTQVVCQAIAELDQTIPLSVLEQTALSRRGSGSSCRSFFPDWAVWHDEYASPIDLPFRKLVHRVIVIDDQAKQVSSSDAHRAVHLSPYFTNRAERAKERLENLIQALHNNDWRACHQVVWAEFIDMHELFATANPAFHYINEAADQVLEYLKTYWKKHKDGPLITMDAGPNIHLLFRPDQQAAITAITQTLGQQYQILGEQHAHADNPI